MSRSSQGHFKVNPDKMLNKNIFLQFLYVFGFKGVFHKAAVDIFWLGNLPTRILGGGGGGYSDYRVYVAWRGNTPLLYHPSPLISPSLPALTSVQKEVNWSIV